ncbi:MAG: hypothetical protein JWN11_1628, partial [Hyphomicrobiales bacterium]|nr:hypothetical protein [Hyphomicrobiales bacterium]
MRTRWGLGRATALGLATGLLLLSAPTAWAFNQAPQLQAKVADGVLPPVEQRLPAEPLQLQPLSEVGTYGGEMRTDLLGG